MNDNIVRIGGGNFKESNPIKKQRNSNLELYRIIVMIMIVAHHYVVNGSGLSTILEQNPYSPTTIFYYLFGAWGKTGINCFVLITGYFMCTSNITLRKFLKLALEIIFYNVVIYLCFCAFGVTTPSVRDGVLMLIPVRNCNTDFTSAFILFYLAIPFLNILRNGLDRKSHIMLLALLLFVYTAMPMVKASVTFNYLSWFSVLYFIASYIRIHGLPHNDSAKYWGWATLFTVLLSIFSIVCPLLFHRGCTYFFVSDSNHIMAIFTAVTSFMFFKNLKVRYNKVINTIASTTFGVFLIHTHSHAMRQLLWNDLFDNPGHYSTPLYAIGVVALLFVSCSLIDFIRISTIELPLLNVVERGCQGLYNKIKINIK